MIKYQEFDEKLKSNRENFQKNKPYKISIFEFHKNDKTKS